MSTLFPRPTFIRHAGLGIAAIAALSTVGCGRDEAPSEETASAAPEVEVIEAAAPMVAPEPVFRPEPVVVGADGPARALEATPFEYSWDLQFDAPVHASWTDDAVADLVFFQTQDRVVHAVEARTGHVRWMTRPLPSLIKQRPDVKRIKVPTGQTGEFGFDDRLYIVAYDSLFVFDVTYGQLIWRYHLGRAGRTGFLPSTGPLVLGSLGNTRIFFGDWEGRVRALGFDTERQAAYHNWQYNLYSTITADPTGDEGIAYIGDHKGKLHSFDMDREHRWEFNTGGAITAAPLIRGRNCYLGSSTGVLHVLNRHSGVETGRLFLDGPILRTPFSFAGEPKRVYVWVGEGSSTGLQAVDTYGDEIAFEDVEKFNREVDRVGKAWYIPGVRRLVSSSPKHLFVTRDDNSRVLAVNRETGAIEWHWDINPDRAGGNGSLGKGGVVEHVTEYVDPSDGVRSVFTVDAQGYVVAYRLFGQF